MRRLNVWRGTAAIVSTVMAAGFGFSGLAAAASINNTGPGSTNKVITSQHTSCRVTNNNNVSTVNSNNQSAHSGNASVSDNTGSWSSGWGNWNPPAWQGQGHGFDEWHSGFMGFMASHSNQWQDNWGSMGGSASSGDASNWNDTQTFVNIDNDDGCGESMFVPGVGGGSIHTTGPHSSNSVTGVLSNNTSVHNNNNVVTTNSNVQSAHSGNASVSGNTSGGSASSGDASNMNSTSSWVSIVN